MSAYDLAMLLLTVVQVAGVVGIFLAVCVLIHVAQRDERG